MVTKGDRLVRRTYSPELVERVCELYQAGQGIRETARQVGVPYATANKWLSRQGIEIRPNRAGEDSVNWRGDAAGYRALHMRVSAARGKASQHTCEHCGNRQAQDWAHVHDQPPGDVMSYIPLCKLCHKFYDQVES